MRGALVMTMVMNSPSRREVSPAERLCRSPRLVPPRFRLAAAEFRPERFSSIFFSSKDFIWEKMGVGEPPGGPRGRGRAPHPHGQVGPPLVSFFCWIFFIISKDDFRRVSGLLEQCRIGFQCLLPFQPEFQLPAFPLFMVNLVK